VKEQMGLFGTSGIRGIFEQEITVDLARKLGAATAKRYKRIVVGRDARLSGPLLDDGFSRAAAMMGAEVIQIGICPTPAVAYAARALGAGCAVVITASHNPPQYNGFKFFNPDGAAFSKEQEAEIEKLIEYAPVILGRTKVSEISKFAHNDKILSNFAGKFAGMKVVLNCNGGAATATATLLFEKLGCAVTQIFERPDGEYIPNPKAQPDASLGDWNRIADLDTTLKIVAEKGADVGIIFDGDADRMLAVAPSGPVSPDKLFYLFAAHFAPGGRVVDVVDGSSVLDSVCTVVRVPVGDVNVSVKLKELGSSAAFGGEGCSGTYVWPLFHYCPDGIYSAVKLLEMLSEKGSLDKLVATVPENFLKREKVSVPNEMKAAVMEKARAQLDKGWKANFADGIRVDFPGAWFLIRPSGTEPFIRITAEAETEQKALEMLEKARKLIAP
jgi:phosphoglucosamine mutase